MVHIHALVYTILNESISSLFVYAPLHKRKYNMQNKLTLFVNLFLNLESVQKTQEEVQLSHR